MEQDKQTLKPREYVYIGAWGAMLGSQGYFIRAEQERAARDGAPADAIYPRCGGEGWVCASDLEPRHRRQVRRFLGEGVDLMEEEWKGATNGR